MYTYTTTRKFFICLVSTVIFISLLILIEYKLRKSNIDFIRPIRVIISPNSADWREYHMFTDTDFIPDPYLFWKLKPGGLVNPKGFIGPDFSIVKPFGIFRVFCLGDSNTQGSKETSYSYELSKLLQNKPISNTQFEIINAGASGYSSLQGLRLFSEILEYSPDLVIICFGWNDPCLTKRVADKNFKPVNRYILRLERFLYRFKIYQFLKFLSLKFRYQLINREGNFHYSSRVSLEDYEKNLLAMYDIAKENKVNIIFVTRPCILKVEPWMSHFVENTRKYNTIMKMLAKRLEIDLIDAESICWGHPEYFVDSCHFNTAGNKLLAEEIHNYLKGHY